MMKFNTLKNTVLAASLLVLSSGVLSANQDIKLLTAPKSLSSYEGRASGSANFLFWKTNTEGTRFATTVENGVSTEVSTKGKWHPGFRLAYGYAAEDLDAWKFNVEWTRFHSHSKQGVAQVAPLLTSSAKAALKLNVLDVAFEKEYAVTNSKVSVTPRLGLRGVCFKNWFDSSAFQGYSHFRGIGLYTGSESNWKIQDDLSLVGKLYGSLICGTASASNSDHVSKNDKLRFNLEGFAGIQWDKAISGDKAHLTVQAGYEISQWFQLNESVVRANSVDAGQNVGFNGLTLKGTYSF